MSKLKLIPILLFSAIFLYLLSLPSYSNLQPISQVQKKIIAMPNYDYIKFAKELYERGSLSQALSILKIAAMDPQQESVAKKEVTKIVGELKTNSSVAAQLDLIGNRQITTHNSWDVDSISLEEFFNKQNIDKIHKELFLLNSKPASFSSYLNKVDAITEVLPKSKVAFDLLSIANDYDILTDGYKKEVIEAITAINSSENVDAKMLENALDSVIPTLELLKNCSTWNQFSTLITNVQHSKQISILLSLVKLSKDSPEQLTELILVANGDTELITTILGYINDNGLYGLNNLYSVILKGPEAIKLLIENPTEVAPQLTGNKDNHVCFLKAKWMDLLKDKPILMEGMRYFFLAVILTAILLFSTSQQNLARILFIKEPENATFIKVVSQLFIVLLSLFALTFAFNVFFTSSTSTIPVQTMNGKGAPNLATIQQQLPPKQNSLTGISIVSLLVIIFMQFTVYAKAVTELKNIKSLEASPTLKLVQLKHADIFFDLPIYLGLLGTVSSFVIMLFDPTASRIVAYSSTIIGIIFSASIRVFYVYPLQKGLTNEAEQIRERMVN